MKQSYIQANKKKRALFLLVIICLLGQQPVSSQDFHLSQYDAPPLFLNPSMTGLFNGQYRIHAHYRNQWLSVTNKPFTTTGISFDMPVKKLGIGLQAMNYRAGAGNYNVFNALLSVGYSAAFDSDKRHHVAFGIQTGITQKSLNAGKLTFGNQFSTKNGGSFDNGIPSGEVFDNTNFSIFNMNAGIIYFYAKDNARLNPFMGLSAFNINQPVETFYIAGNKLATRYYLHGGVKINIDEKIQLLPKFIYMKQASTHAVSASVLLYYFMKEDTYLIVGPTYRHKDAAIIEVGVSKGRYTARVSYDITISTLQKAAGYRGGFEVSVTYIARKHKSNASVNNCPRL